MTLTGRAALLVALGALPVAWAPGWGTVWGWLGLCVLGVLLDLLLAASPRTLSVTREPTSPVRLGESCETTFLLTNLGGRRLRGLARDAWQPGAGAHGTRHRVDLPPGERRRYATGLTPTRRGDRLAVGVAVRSAGPLGLACRQLTLPAPWRVRVLPPFHSRRHLPSKLAQLRELEGRAALHRRGQGTEFDSLRDYVDGDDVRSIDWRATARRQQVVVRTWRPERDRRVLLLLDTSRTAAARIGDGTRLDAAMDAALLLAALATRAGDRVDLIAMDRRVRARVESASRNEVLPRFVEAMAGLEPELVETDWSAVTGVVRSRFSQRALVVLLSPLEAAPVEEGLLPVVTRLTSHHTVVLASVADPAVHTLAQGRGTAHAVYGAAAAARAELDRTAVTAELGRLGVEVLDAPPDQLPPRLADHYLALKAAGRL